MRISKEEIEAAKRGQDLRAVIESYGVCLGTVSVPDTLED